MKVFLKVLLSGLAAGAVLIQFVNRPERVNPPEDPAQVITAHIRVPLDVRAVLERSCYDCHSNRTLWPWYSGIAPASWLVARDVEEGREHLNFSEWGTYPRKRQAARLEGIVAEVDKGTMPLGPYLLLHGNALISDEEKNLVCDWAEEAYDSLLAVPE